MANSTGLNIRKVSKMANVSIATVSRVLNNRSSDVPISQTTKDKVLKICHETEFAPNIHAKRLFSNKSEMIGMVIPPRNVLTGAGHTFTDYNIAELLSGVEETASDMGYHVVLITCDKEFLERQAYLHLFRNKSIDGMLIWGLRKEEKYIEELIDNKFPFIILNSGYEHKDVNMISSDNFEGSCAITEHLIKLGHKRIGYILGRQDSWSDDRRYEGYKAALQKYGLTCDDLIGKGDLSEESGYSAAQYLLDLTNPPTAILAVNDMTAIGVMRAIRDRKLTIHNDVAVAGGDGISLTVHVTPPLTTFRMPMYEIGVLGFKNLFEIMTKQVTQRVNINLKTELLIRESTAGINYSYSIPGKKEG